MQTLCTQIPTTKSSDIRNGSIINYGHGSSNSSAHSLHDMTKIFSKGKVRTEIDFIEGRDWNETTEITPTLTKQFLYMRHVISGLKQQSLCVEMRCTERRHEVKSTEERIHKHNRKSRRDKSTSVLYWPRASFELYPGRTAALMICNWPYTEKTRQV